jgi:hypothetical protein
MWHKIFGPKYGEHFREPPENGYVESYIGKLRDELISSEVMDTLGGGERSCRGLAKGIQSL